MNLKFTRLWVAVSVLITALFSVITTKATRLSLTLVMFILLGLSSKTFAQTETLPAGSFIINMGVTPQTNSNALKPYGMIYELMRDHDVSVKWVINPSKAKDGIDFTFNAVDYKGGTFIIPAQFITTAVRTRINYWISQGVVANLTTSALVVNVTHTLTSLPRWVLNDENTDIAKGFFTNAGITDANTYPVKTPSQLNSCDDIYVMPHSEPTWATHSNLFYWNLNSKGSIWAGCKTVSVMENLNGPDINNSSITRRLNFLMSDGPTPSQNAVPDGSHSDGTPPYTLQSPTHPFMQFMGVTDAAHMGGAEQIYLPNKLGTGWRPSTTIGSFDPTQSNVPTLSNGPAAAIAFGRGFGDNNRGWVLYEAGHDIGKDNNPENVAAQRAFFNFSFLAAQDKQSTITPVVNFPSAITAGQSYNVSVTASSSIGAGNFLYSWTSSCGGIFTNPTAASTSFTVQMITGNSTCIITLKVTDDCGRETLYTQSIVVNGGPPPAGVIGQFVWNDVNKNGIKDVGEAVLSGVTVKLYADADNNNIIDNATPLATTTTNASGIYTFTGLANGYYIVGVVAPTGFAEGLNSTIGEDPDTDVANDNNGVNTLANGEVTSNNIYIASGTEPSTDGDGTDGNLTLDFGLVDPTNFGVVTGSRCYESPTKPTIVNASQQWRNNGDGTITFRTTLAKTFVDNTYGTSAIGWPSGHTFSNLTGSDKITIAFYDALGVKKLEFNQDYFTLNAAGSSGYKSFGVSGGDGGMVLGSSSSVLDWQTSMDVNFNTFKYILTTNSPSTTTTYTPNSTYPKWIYDVWYEVTIDASVFGTAGFGYPLITGMHASPSKTGNNTEAVVVANCAALNIGNSVWVDANNNGIKDAGEQPVTGALVKLYVDANGDNIPDGAAIATTSTDGNGLYAFTNLAEGKYIVGVTIPTGFTNAITTATSSSADNNTDNDNNGVTVVSNELRSNAITLNFTAEPTTDGDGSNGNLTLDFGLKFTGSIGDFVWYDKNANGLQDANESGIAGVTVTLNGPGGTKTTTTDANGFYVFNSLATGTYTVTFSTPVGYVATPSNQATNDFLDSDPLSGVVSVNYTAGTSNYTVDAGFYKPLQLGNLVWNDTNKNGLFDNGETGINNATVRLYNDANNDNIVDGAALQTVTTNASGNYLFSNVVPGNYIVGVVLPTGFSKTIVTATGSDPDNDVNSDNNGLTVVAGEVRSNSIMLINGTEPTTDGDGSDGNLTLDFGIFNPSDFGPYDAVKCYQSTTKPDIVTATQYWRNNGDGTITIRSTLAKTFVDNTYGTSAIGWASGHTFSNLTGSDQLTLALYDAAGVKKLEFKQDYITASSAAPSGYKTLLVSGGDGGMLSGSAASILSGTTSMDVNFNDYGYVLITNSPTTTTSYAANVTYPNWIYDVWYEVTVSAAAFGTSGFGYPVITSTHASPSKTGNNTELVVPVPCDALSLGNLVWIDNDNDGVKDAGEPGVSGTLVKLYVDANGDNIADGSAIATTTTDANGNYLFTNLTANKYIVGVTIPSGYAQAITTATSSNPDNNTDNDNNGINLVSGELRSNFITLSTFAEPTTDGDASNGNLTLDFGIRFNGSIGDFVWEDNNGNGIQDAGEAGIAGVTVTLNGPGGTQITNTDANGFYSFSSLATGSYTVTFATPAGYVSSPSNQGSNDAVDSDPINGVASVSYVAGTNNNTIDAGFYKPVSIGNLVWFDKNNNGLKDTNEVGLVGLTVKLYLDANNDNIVDGAAIATTLTDQNGNYLFANLAPGNYIVGVTTVNGFTRGFLTATANDPDNDIDNDNNGINIVSGEVRSNNMLVTGSTEPTNDGDNSSGNLTLDFGLNNPGDFGDFSGTKCYENTIKPTIVNARQVWRTNADGSITIRTTLAKTFVDNTYGTGIIGWSSHKFSDLTGSDKLTMSLFDVNGVKKIEFSQDYITASTNFPSGYGSLGVSGGDGGMVSGNASSIVSATSSMDVNFNNYGYVLITNSPTTNASYTPNSTYPNWIYDVWYEVTVSASTFGTAGFGYPLITGTHASPSKTGSNSETVVPVNCNTLNLGNLVWLDVNGNGIKDVTELGINGVTVKLYKDSNGDNLPDGGAISTTVTSNGGIYNFNNLGADKYIVGVSLPAGYVNTVTTATSNTSDNNTDNDNNGITTISNELRSNFITLSVNGEPTTDGDGNNGNLTLDFGLRGTASLGDFVWDDLNANGLQDVGEVGINNVVVTLTFPNGSTLSTTTNASGFYSFANLIPGTYSVAFTTPSGFTASLSNVGSDDTKDSDPVSGVVSGIVLTAGQTNNSIDAGFYKKLNLGNVVWLDLNSNGLQDVGENGIPNLVVNLYLDANGDNVPDGVSIANTTTNSSGIYTFAGLNPNKYIVGVVLPSGSTPAVNTATSSNPDNDVDADNNGVRTVSGELRSNFITLINGAEPASGVDGDGTTGNLTLDFGLIICQNALETFPNQFNTGFSKPLTNSTFVGSTGTWTTTTSSNATIVVLTPYYSPSTSHAIKVVNWATNGSQGETPTPGVGTTSTTSPTTALTNVCCPAELTLQYTLWTYTVNSLDNTTTFAWDFSNDNGVTWNQITSTTPAAIFSQYGANAKVNITIPIPLMYQNANFRYRIRSSKPIHNPYNFFVFIDDIKIGSPTSCAPTLNLGNFVWNDINGDGDFDTFEPGVGAVTVRLYLDANGDNIADGAAIATTTTNAQGFYNFSSLPAGNYIVGIVIPTGYINSINTTTSSNPNNDINDDNNGIVFLGANVAGTEVRSNRITLSVGGEPAIGVDGDGTNGNQTVDFGLCGLGGLGDFVWNDLNNNGIQDIGEPGLGGVNVTLTYPDGTLFTVPTASDGSYFFANLGPGTYTVTFATPSGFTASPSNAGGDDTKDSDPVAGTVSVTLTASQVNATIDAGFNSPITLGNLVWFDVNNNGIRDAGEPGIATATVNLYLDANNDNIADGAAIRTTTTDANGLYNFSSLTANNYIVGVVIPTGYSVVTTNGGDPDNNIDNDNNGVTTVGSEIRSNSVTLALGTEPTTDGDGNNGNLTVDFAFRGALNLGNLVWVDKCTYGIKDASEVGFNNATLNLYMDVNGDNLPDGAAIATTTTNASGIYGFSNLIAGNYIVGLVLPTKYAGSATTVNSASPNLDTDSDNNGIRTASGILFSNFITLSIGGEPSTDGDGTNGNLTLDFAIALDTDGDTIANIIDIDDDNDGITDVNESGGNDPLADCDNDCIPNYLDNIPGGSCTPWTDCNSDGINDFYDWDRDGIINSLDLDSDNDGILDVQEARPNCVNFASVINGMVTGTDADKNGLLSSADNGSGFANQAANGLQPQDLDRDGRPNFLDLDSDGDGITDATESRATYDTDGVVSGVDADGDGVRAESFGSILPTIADNFNGHGANGIVLLDSDSDGKPNVYDIDSDNDGITDNVEGQSTCGYQVPTSNDCDGDGVLDTYDLGGCASCLRTSGGITPFDKDGDGTPDYLDTDTDNDGAPDIYEGHSIPSPTGNVPPLNFWIAATNDADCDGLWDYFDQFNIGTATSNFANNVTHSNMGTGGNFDGPIPRGSIAQLPKSKTGSACDDGDRDWRDVSILPVTLLEFKGNLNNNAVKLTWSVSREVNIDSYEVERSFDGVSFTKIASIVASNNNSSSTSTYTSNDNLQAVTAPNVYYRLSIIDKIGTVKNSNTINFKLNTKGKIGIVVNPNPAISFFFIKITTSKDAFAQIKVVDMLGRVLITQNGKIFAGTNTQTFTNINNLSAGTYVVQVTIDGEVYNEKLIVSK